MGNLVLNRVNLAETSNALRQNSSRSSLGSNSSSASINKLDNQRLAKSSRPAPLPPSSTTSSNSAAASFIARMSNMAAVADSDTLSRWMMLSQTKPQSEVTLASVPLFLAAHANFVFSLDQTSYLSIYERVFTLELKLKNSVKLNMPGIKGFAHKFLFIEASSLIIRCFQSRKLIKDWL